MHTFQNLISGILTYLVSENIVLLTCISIILYIYCLYFLVFPGYD